MRPTPQAVPKLTRREPKPAANVFLSVYEVQLVIRELEGYEKRIYPSSMAERRRVRALIEKLYGTAA